MAKMDDWMRQDKSVNSNLQESNRCSPSACVQWHLEKKEYLCIILGSFISRPFLWVLCKDKNRGSASSSLMCRIILGSLGLSVSDLGTLEWTFNDQFEDE